MKKVVVTAPSSAVGSNFIQYAKGKADIITVGRKESDILFDFVKDSELLLPQGQDTILHMAGMLHADSDSEILDIVDTNVGGLLKVCIAARKCDIKQVIFMSSINACLSDKAPYYSYYSLSKKQAEQMARLYCKRNGIALCIIRPSQIFGIDWSFSKTQHLLYHMIKCALKNEPIEIYGTHDALRNYIFEDNLYQILLYAINYCVDADVDAIDRKNYRLSEAAKIIIESVQSNSKMIFLDDKMNLYDNSFITEIDYFEKWGIPFIGFEKAIQRMGYYYRKGKI